MDPNISLHYMAAIIQDSIAAYKSVGKVDISKNPGLTATLYNLGDPWSRAAKFRRTGRSWPRENYYGWLVNDRNRRSARTSLSRNYVLHPSLSEPATRA